MQRRIILISIILAGFIGCGFFVAVYDFNWIRRRESGSGSGLSALSLVIEAEQLRETRAILRRRMDVVPPWLRGVRRPRFVRSRYFNERAKDPRYSDQKKIRRRSINS